MDLRNIFTSLVGWLMVMLPGEAKGRFVYACGPHCWTLDFKNNLFFKK